MNAATHPAGPSTVPEPRRSIVAERRRLLHAETRRQKDTPRPTDSSPSPRFMPLVPPAGFVAARKARRRRILLGVASAMAAILSVLLFFAAGFFAPFLGGGVPFVLVWAAAGLSGVFAWLSARSGRTGTTHVAGASVRAFDPVGLHTAPTNTGPRAVGLVGSVLNLLGIPIAMIALPIAGFVGTAYHDDPGWIPLGIFAFLVYVELSLAGLIGALKSSGEPRAGGILMLMGGAAVPIAYLFGLAALGGWDLLGQALLSPLWALLIPPAAVLWVAGIMALSHARRLRGPTRPGQASGKGFDRRAAGAGNPRGPGRRPPSDGRFASDAIVVCPRCTNVDIARPGAPFHSCSACGFQGRPLGVPDGRFGANR